MNVLKVLVVVICAGAKDLEHHQHHQQHNLQVDSLSGIEYLNFINSIRSAASRKQYAYCILNYMRFHNVSDPSQLMFNNDVKTIERNLLNYIVYIRDRIAWSTRVLYCSAVITFYAMNDILVNKKKLYRYLGELTRVHRDRAYTTSEIGKLLSFSDLRLQSIVLLLASAGVRSGSLQDLRVGHLSPVSQFDLYKVTIYENAIKSEYYTFTTPECRKAIDEYLGYRERSGERLTPNSPLFREQFDVNDPFQIVSPRPLHNRTLQTIFDRALVKAGLRVIEHETETTKNKGRVRKEVSRFNGFRKFFNTNLVRAKVSPQIKEMLMGHSIDLDDNYYRPRQDEVLDEYVKAVNLLTINDEHRLRMQVKELKIRVDKFDQMQKQIDDIRTKMLQKMDELDEQEGVTDNETEVEPIGK